MGLSIIKSVYIKRFRSFDTIAFGASGLNIFSGKNNAGKSNILRALNLFFNHCNNYDSPYSHQADYNRAFRGDAGGKRDIQITINFLPTGDGALQYDFSITKIFSKGSNTPITIYYSSNDNIQKKIESGDGNISRQFTTFLNKIDYLYIPAVRDKSFIKSLLLRYERIIKSDTVKGAGFDESVAQLSKILRESSIGISNEFQDYMGIPAQASLSTNTMDVLGAIEINVTSGAQMRNKRKNGAKGEIIDIPINLFSSGDGVIMAYLVYFLSYLTCNDPKKFIWGFEEPENSLEYSKVQLLAEQFYNTFMQNAQIFITTHSPAFINLRGRKNVELYRVYTLPQSIKDKEQGLPNRMPTKIAKVEDIRKQLKLFGDDPSVLETLEQEIFFAEQSAEIEKFVRILKEEREKVVKQQRDFEKEHAAWFPSKVFIYEDVGSKEFWKELFAKNGIGDVEIVPSCGCCDDKVEKWVLVQRERNNGYNPIVVREIDRDGLSEKQIQRLSDKMNSKYKSEINYTYLPLPVNELENFVCRSFEYSSNFIQQNRVYLSRKLTDTVSARMRKYGVTFGYDELFPNPNTDAFLKVCHENEDEALKDWVRYMPGKEILSLCGKSSKECLQRLCDAGLAALPVEMQQYIQKIKNIFAK